MAGARIDMGLSEGLTVRMGIDLFAGVGPAQRAQKGKGLCGHLGTGEKPVSLGSLVLCVYVISSSWGETQNIPNISRAR